MKQFELEAIDEERPPIRPAYQGGLASASSFGLPCEMLSDDSSILRSVSLSS